MPLTTHTVTQEGADIPYLLFIQQLTYTMTFDIYLYNFCPEGWILFMLEMDLVLS